MPLDDPEEAAWEAAGRLLAYRARSEAELRTRLARKGYEQEVVDRTIARLRELRLLDDDAFARERAESLARRGSGPRKIRARLAADGLDAGAASEALDRALSGAGGEDALARATLARRYRDLEAADAVTRRKAASWLVRRGFSPTVAGRVCGIFSDVEE